MAVQWKMAAAKSGRTCKRNIPLPAGSNSGQVPDAPFEMQPIKTRLGTRQVYVQEIALIGTIADILDDGCSGEKAFKWIGSRWQLDDGHWG